MNSVLAAEELLDQISSIDRKVKVSMETPEVKENVMKHLTSSFDGIVENFPHLVQDVQRSIVKYHQNKGNDGKITDFVHLVDWYNICLNDAKNEKEYWDRNGKYFGLRMNEVINMFLMARFNLGLV